MIYITTLIFCEFAIVANICDKPVPEINICLEQSASTRNGNVNAKMVGVTIGATVHLECNFCNVEDNYEAKLWYYKKRGSNYPMAEINLPMKSNLTDCRVLMTSSHRLDIKNFDLDDSGIYDCKHNYIDNAVIFTYVLDGVFNYHMNETTKRSSKDYGRYINVMNTKFLESNDELFLTLRRNNNFTFQMTITWDDWGPCVSQGKQGIRRRRGLCLVHPISYDNYYQTLSDSSDKFDLQDKSVFLCHSISLNKSFPKLSTFLRAIPKFEMAELCHPSIETTSMCSIHHCSKNNCDVLWKKDGEELMQNRIPKQMQCKYKTTNHIGENSHITLLCPEVSPEATVEWYKDNKPLDSTYSNNMAECEEEPHITIDSNNALYILHATKNEEAIYACYVDGLMMKMFDVKVVSKSKLLNQEFIRYSIYLGFVLSLTLTCYCAGICVAWHRRSSFADPFHHKIKRNDGKSIHFKDSEETHMLLP